MTTTDNILGVRAVRIFHYNKIFLLVVINFQENRF